MALDYMNAKGWLTPKERDYLRGLAQLAPKTGTIVNVGVEYGASLVCIRDGNPTATIFAIDIDNSKYAGPDVRAGFITGDSGELALRWTQPIHFAFIDGDHSDKGIQRDLKWADYIEPGCVIAFHDCLNANGSGDVHPICPEVNYRVMQWFRSVHNWEELDWADSMRVFRRIE